MARQWLTRGTAPAIAARLLCLVMLASGTEALAQAAGGQPGVDQSIASWRNRANSGTVGLVSGGVAGTYVRIGSDLAAVLDNDPELRILPILGKGSVQNLADIMYLKGIDVGIVQSDVMAYARRNRLYPGVEKNIQYIAKLYNEELHLLAGPGIRELQDLKGQKVNFDTRGSGTFMTASLVFDLLQVPVEPTTYDQALALERLKSGEIAALAYVAGKPTQLFRDLKAEDGVKFLSLPLTPELLETYLPSRLTNEDYPGLVSAEEPIATLAVGAVMAVYNWEPETDRYRKVARFVDAFFERFPEFQKPPRHAKWKEVNLAAQVPGWNRFRRADELLRRSVMGQSGGDPTLRRDFDTFLENRGSGRVTDQQKAALFEEFVRWRSRQ